MKSGKLTAMILTLTMAVGLMAGCGTSNSSQAAATTENNTEIASESEAASEADSETAAESAAASTGDGKILVVYYSATGNTKGVAETIAQITGGDLFEIQPEEPYTDDDLDWTDKNSRVSKEHDDESLRDVALTEVTPEDFSDVSVVILGYPIWWQEAAWPVNNFVKNNDFTGKTVIPFCTSASSGIGNSGNLLKNMAGTGDWRDGERFNGGASEEDVRAWIDGLGL